MIKQTALKFPVIIIIEFLFFFQGKDLLYELLYDFLFPASKLIMDNLNEARNDEFLHNFNPK